MPASGPSVAPFDSESPLLALLRPPGQGIPVISAGKGAGATLLEKHFSAVFGGLRDFDPADPSLAWHRSLERLERAKVAVLGVPLDTGAGIRRGAMYGPRGVRTALLERAEYLNWLEDGTVVDLGDVFVNPHLLSDGMLSPEQIRASQDAMYSQVDEATRRTFPVAALDQVKFVLQFLLKSFPGVKPFVIGGDHSVAWPVSQVMAAVHAGAGGGELGIVQPDAHTDLLETRLGVKYCFGTWSFHANDLIGRGGRMVQLGIRQSGRDRAHWERTMGVRQFWADEILAGLARDPSGVELLDEIVAHLKSAGVKRLYFSNDIDGTDSRWASATGTPADGGMPPEFVLAAIERLGREFEWVAADVVEVAPDLGGPDAARITCGTAASYAVASIRALAG